MSDEDKKPYQEKAAAERERVAADLEAWKKIHGDALPDRQGTGLNRGSLVIPTARIRKICKLDPEVSGLSREAVLLVTAAAELATAALGRECVSVAQIQNRRKLLPEDVAHVCSTRERFLFLREDIQDIARKSQQEQKEAAAARKTKGKQSNTAAAAGTKPLTSYFASK
jgi:DNA-directed RNA polymerase I subunit RPA43